MSHGKILTDTDNFPAWSEQRTMQIKSGHHFFLPGSNVLQKKQDSSRATFSSGHQDRAENMSVRERKLVSHLNQLALAYL